MDIEFNTAWKVALGYAFILEAAMCWLSGWHLPSIPMLIGGMLFAGLSTFGICWVIGYLFGDPDYR